MADSTRPVDKQTLEQLERSFIQLSIGIEADTRRALLATLNLSFDQLCKQANTADKKAILSFQHMFDSGVIYAQTLRDFADLLDIALERIVEAFQAGNSTKQDNFKG